MSDQHDEDETLVLRGMAHRMSQGIEIKNRKHGLFAFHNIFLGTDAVEWLIADPKSGVNDLDGAIQMGQRLIDHGYISRVSRELKAQQVNHFGHSERAKSEFRSGGSFYRFDDVRISPFQLHVAVFCARQLKSMDLNGKNDPYVKINLGNQTQSTRVRLKTNDPSWNEHFVFGVNSVEAQQLNLSVWDYDKFKSDDHIGSCKIGLSHLPCSDASEVRGFGSGGGGLGDGDDGSGHPHSPVPGRLGSRYCLGEACIGSILGRPAPGEINGGGVENVDSSAWKKPPLGGNAWSGSVAATDVASDLDFDPDDMHGQHRSSSLSVGRGNRTKRGRKESSVKGIVSWVKRRGSAGDVLHKGAHSDGDEAANVDGGNRGGSHHTLAGHHDGPQRKHTFYRLLGTNEKRAAKDNDDQGGFSKPTCGELACDLWLTRFLPKPLAVQGEAKFSLRCRIWEMSGVTSSEERNLGELNSTVIRHKAVLMMCGNRVSSAHYERRKDKEKTTTFNGSLITLDFRANMATDMLKFVVQQKINPVELAFKPVATVSIPLRSIPVTFPGGETSEQDLEAAAAAAAQAAADTAAQACATQGGKRLSLCCRGSNRTAGAATVAAEGGGAEAGKAPWSNPGGGAHGRRYRLQTLAGPMTTRIMDNGFVVMSLTLVPSGNDLLGEEDPVDNEDVKVPPPPPPPPLTQQVLDVSVKCGYQRLRKALLWNDSKLQAAFCELLNYSEVTQSLWLDRDGGAGLQDDLTGCTRERTFVIPKSAIVAATKTEAHDVILADGPSFMAYESRNRTPGVSFGDKFVVVVQFMLIKEGPNKCRLQTSAQANVSDKVMSFVQGQIVSAVAKVTKEDHHHLLGLIEDALSGKGAGGGPASRRGLRKRSRRSFWCWCTVAFILVLAAGFFVMRDALAPRGRPKEYPLWRRFSVQLFGSEPSAKENPADPEARADNGGGAEVAAVLDGDNGKTGEICEEDTLTGTG